MEEREIVINIDSFIMNNNTMEEARSSEDKVGYIYPFKVCGRATMSVDELAAKSENQVSLLCSSNSKNVGGVSGENNTSTSKKEKRMSLSGKKAPKPPRPPRGLSLDAADQKLIKEISELLMIKRARIERMKALKRMKAAKASSSAATSSSGNTIAMLFTILFCIVIIFQGCHPLGILPSSSSAIGITTTSPNSNRATEAGILVDQEQHRNLSISSVHVLDLPDLMDNKAEEKSFQMIPFYLG